MLANSQSPRVSWGMCDNRIRGDHGQGWESDRFRCRLVSGQHDCSADGEHESLEQQY